MRTKLSSDDLGYRKPFGSTVYTGLTVTAFATEKTRQHWGILRFHPDWS
jgi:hypothetical protein